MTDIYPRFGQNEFSLYKALFEAHTLCKPNLTLYLNKLVHNNKRNL